MADIVNGPDFQYATTVVLSDTEDNAVGSCGLHNTSATGGNVNVIFATGPQTPVTFNLASEQFIFCGIRRVLSTGTTIAEADLRILY